MFKILLGVLLLSVHTIQFTYDDPNGIDKRLEIVSRNEWKADPPLDGVVNLKLPVDNVVICHTVTPFCYNQVDCSHQVKSIQRLHIIDREFSDIGYNFLISGDGKVYEGRGWDKQGAHTKSYNNVTIGIAFIGNYMEVEPKTAQLDALRMLLMYGVEMNKLTNNYRLYGHRQLRPFLSPGDKLYNIIKTWDHWSEKYEVRGNKTGSLSIVSRDEWNADPPEDEIINLKLPMDNVVICHTVTPFCDNKADCSSQIKSIQRFHIKDQKFGDIGYNFLIGGDGKIYEGRGWYKQGAHTKSYNNVAIGIALIGNFMKIKPTKIQLNALKRLLKYGVETNKLKNNYKLYGHRQLIPTLSPGNNLYNIIKTWDHWSEKYSN